MNSIEEEIEWINNLQIYLMDFSSDDQKNNFDLQSIQQFKEKLDVSTIIENILVAVKCYPTKLPQIVDKVNQIKELFQNPLDLLKFSKFLIQQTFQIICQCKYDTKPTYIAFLYHLTKNNVLKLENVIHKIIKI